MVTKKKKKKLKKKPPKGKLLSQALEEKEAARADEEQGDDELSNRDLASSPPPRLEDDEEPEEEKPEPEEEEEAEREEREAQEEVERERAAEKAAREEDDDEAPASEAGDEEGEEEELAAAQMGHQRYVIGGFFAAWLVGAYILGKTLETIWSRLAARDWFVEKATWMVAIPHEGELISRSNISLGIGVVIAAIIVLRYYYRPDVRQWTDEVAEEIGQVKWPTRKEIGNNTVVVLVTATLLTVYLAILDRFWSFVTNLIYTGGTGPS